VPRVAFGAENVGVLLQGPVDAEHLLSRPPDHEVADTFGTRVVGDVLLGPLALCGQGSEGR